MKPAHPLLTAFLAASILFGPVLFAGTIASFKTPNEIRELVSTAIAEWVLKPSDATGCAGGDCCPGATSAQCDTFALEVQLNQTGWAPRVEEQLQFDGDWLCNTWPPAPNSNDRKTACTTVSGSPTIDVSRILSEIAALRVPL